MKVAVITPYHEPDSPYLSACINSVQGQSYTNFLHVMVGDGCSMPAEFTHPKLHNIALPQRLNNYGDSPRSIGVIYAFALGVDAVSFLDADNWYAPDHLARMVNTCINSQADVVTSRRYLCHLDGTVMGICPESDGVIFCDTNCLLVTQKLAEEAGLWWLIPEDMHVIDDRMMWDTLIHATDKIASTQAASVFYRTAFEFHYQMFNLPPPPGSKTGATIGLLGNTINRLQQRAIVRARARGLGKSQQ
jgi:glycosyltransferase involved in cell wall biosynthesis